MHQFKVKEDTITVQSPGRINIIGEHTDYNEGFVLPAAIDKKTIFRLHKNKTASKINMVAENSDEFFQFDLLSFAPISGGWQNLVMGVVWELQQSGHTLTGFDGAFSGDIPLGSGMSSSASLACSFAFGLNELFALKLSNWQLVKICQLAEHHFVGTKCGIMDQFASVMGKKNHAILLDCRTSEYEYVSMDLKNYQFLLLNTNISHSLASSQYNNRKLECEAGVAIFKKAFPDKKIESLRDISYDMLNLMAEQMPPIIFQRCRHVVGENERVLNAVKTLKNQEFAKLGQLMYQSHESLKNDYAVSCTELDFLVAATHDKPYILGSRMMGGGFGGCTINLIEKNRVTEFIEIVSEVYHQYFGISPTPYFLTIENGAGWLSEK